MTPAAADDDPSRRDRLSTGVPGLDPVLDGGLLPGRSVLVRGPPGAGKTLFGLHFLNAGIERGEPGLFVNFGEPEAYLREDVEGFGFDLDDVEFVDLAPEPEAFTDEATYDLFVPSEVEGPSLASEISAAVERVDPDRAVIDPATQLRYLANDPHQFRTQVIALLRMLREAGATTVFTSQQSASAPDDDLQFMSDAVLNVTTGQTRSITVTKFRGSTFQGGEHTVRITDDGFRCAPILVPADHEREFTAEAISSGVGGLDAMLSGGIERGTVTMLTGPTGVGKTTTGVHFMKEAASRDELSVLYAFEESRETLLHRAAAIDVPVHEMLDRGTLRIVEIQPRQYDVNEFSQRVRRDVEEEGASVVMLDGVEGYRYTVRGAGPDPMEELSTLGRYLRNLGVTTIVVNEVHNVTGEFQATERGASYLADNIVFLRHIEYRGELRKVIGVLKKRTSDFEHRLRELEITGEGLVVGDPLPELRGILTGRPEWPREPGSDG